MPSSVSRRRFVWAFGITLTALCAGKTASCSRPKPPPRSRHPEPRRGINGSRVLGRDALGDSPQAIPTFDMVRAIPEVMDGIRCHCNCAVTQRTRSLLTCFEQGGMARDCDLCLEQAVRVYELYRNGHALERIRIVVDAVFT